ncbi:DnaD domain-containing protein [Metabacillus litoralis]|uniref:DnaD domain-containing protein n=1 Tax=Metabacillus litoralis TaxID=152268 RepID=UPI00203B6E62|nr:DnaD domain protein [Metabacillus litoralis]MCM3411253.1 DnaD domain protein [Metabacillus litoralis]
MSSKLLLDEKPLLIIPSLAKQVGLNESIVLQQIHYWLQISEHKYEGYKWIYNTYDEWVEQFSWWSKATIRRIITKLEYEGILVTGNFNKMKIDKTKWYRIDYEKLEGMSSPCAQNEQSRCSDRAVEEVNLSTPLPEITTEITTEKEKEEESRLTTAHSPIQFFEENGFGTISPYISENIYLWVEDLSEELVIEAMKIAIENGSRNWKYVSAVLKDWANKKFKSVKEVHAAQLAYRERKSKQQRSNSSNKYSSRKEVIPDWMNDQNNDHQPRDETKESPIDKDSFELEKKKLFDRIKKYKENKE